MNQLGHEELGPTQPDLLAGLAAEEAERVRGFLGAVVPYLEPPEFMLAGDVAISYHATAAGNVPYSRRPQQRQKIIVTRPGAIDPAAKERLLIAHVHPGLTDSDLSMVVVDPVSKMQAEIVTEEGGLYGREFVPAGESFLPVRTVESHLAAVLLEVQGLHRGIAVSRDRLEDLNALFKLADPDRAEWAWQYMVLPCDRRGRTLMEAYGDVFSAITENSELSLMPQPPYKPANCSKCVEVPDFPLTPKGIIRAAMGGGVYE